MDAEWNVRWMDELGVGRHAACWQVHTDCFLGVDSSPSACFWDLSLVIVSIFVLSISIRALQFGSILYSLNR